MLLHGVGGGAGPGVAAVVCLMVLVVALCYVAHLLLRLPPREAQWLARRPRPRPAAAGAEPPPPPEIPWADAQALMGTGDILLTRGASTASRLVRSALRTHFTHVAMVVRRRPPSGALAVLECTPPDGPRLMPVRAWLEAYRADEVVWRKLLWCPSPHPRALPPTVGVHGLDPAAVGPALEALLGAGLRYPSALRAAVGRAFPAATRRAALATCTDVVGGLLREVGVVPPQCPVHRWTPDHFSGTLAALLEARRAGVLVPERRVVPPPLPLGDDDEGGGGQGEVEGGEEQGGGAGPLGGAQDPSPPPALVAAVVEAVAEPVVGGEGVVGQEEEAGGGGEAAGGEADGGRGPAPPAVDGEDQAEQGEEDGGVEALAVGEGLAAEVAEGDREDGDEEELGPDEAGDAEDPPGGEAAEEAGAAGPVRLHRAGPSSSPSPRVEV